LAVEINGGKAGLRCGGDPPASELRLARGIGGEADGLERKVCVARSFRDR